MWRVPTTTGNARLDQCSHAIERWLYPCRVRLTAEASDHYPAEAESLSHLGKVSTGVCTYLYRFRARLQALLFLADVLSYQIVLSRPSSLPLAPAQPDKYGPEVVMTG